jgi:hypothetical protein
MHRFAAHLVETDGVNLGLVIILPLHDITVQIMRHSEKTTRQNMFFFTVQ